MRESIHALRCDFLCLQDTQSKLARCSGIIPPNFYPAADRISIHPPRIKSPRIFYPHPGYLYPELCVIRSVETQAVCCFEVLSSIKGISTLQNAMTALFGVTVLLKAVRWRAGRGRDPRNHWVSRREDWGIKYPDTGYSTLRVYYPHG